MGEPTLTGLRVCREVARLGSFSAAARELGYSQPAVSRQVAAVEAAVGHVLFERSTGGTRLTAAGAAVAGHAARLIATVEALDADLAALGDRVAGRVRLGAFPAATAALVPAALARLDRENPGVRVTVTEASTPALLRELRARRSDVAVIGVGAGLADYDLSGLVRRRVFAGDLCLAVPSGHRFTATDRGPAVPELAGEPWIIGTGPAGDPQLGAWPTLPDPQIRFRVRSWPARLGLVAAGLGICVIPELATAALPAGVTAVRVDDPNWPGRVTLGLTSPEPDAPTAAVLAALVAAGGEVTVRSTRAT